MQSKRMDGHRSVRGLAVPLCELHQSNPTNKVGNDKVLSLTRCHNIIGNRYPLASIDYISDVRPCVYISGFVSAIDE